MPGTRSEPDILRASTDAEAARNLQARAEQNQATQFNINNMNRGAEAERDLRATRLGVSRGVLDRMEGGMTPRLRWLRLLPRRQLAASPIHSRCPATISTIREPGKQRMIVQYNKR